MKRPFFARASLLLGGGRLSLYGVAQAKSERRNMIEQPAGAAFLRSYGRRRLVLKVVLMGCAAVALCSSTVAAQQSRGAAAHDKIVARHCEVDVRARCGITSG